MITLLLVIKLLLVTLFIILAAYFAGTETALLSGTSAIFVRIKEKHPSKTPYLEYWEQNPNNVLAAIALGTNLSCIAVGVISTSLAIDIGKFSPLFKWLLPLSATVSFLLVGEIFPKVYGRYNHERLSASNIVPLIIYSKFITPVSNMFVAISEKVLGLLGMKLTQETPFFTQNELKLLLNVADNPASIQEMSREVINDNESVSSRQRKMLANIFSFVDRTILQAMRPRPEIFAVDAAQELGALTKQILASGYSRVPVYNRSLDNIIGIIYTKDLTMMLRNRMLFFLEDIIRPAYFVPENAPVSSVLREFKKGHQHMAIAVNEFGTTVGLATIEDLVEEIVGDISDEYDIEEKKIMQMPDNSWIVLGGETIANINRDLGLKLLSRNVTTINGLIMTSLGRIPAAGDNLQIGELHLEILEADNKRVKKVRIRKKS